jgi:hypothetical protein
MHRGGIVMFSDVREFSRTGVVYRRVDELEVPVGAWRAAMCHAGHRQGARVRTFLIPQTVDDTHGVRGQLVFAVRTDPPPDPAVQQQGLLRWWRVDELSMPFERWRTALRRVARREGAQVHTFRVPAPATGSDDHDHDQLVYAVWADATDFPHLGPPPTTPATSSPSPPPPVTNLAEYAADRCRRATSMARHPSRSDGRPGGGAAPGSSVEPRT